MSDRIGRDYHAILAAGGYRLEVTPTIPPEDEWPSGAIACSAERNRLVFHFEPETVEQKWLDGRLVRVSA